MVTRVLLVHWRRSTSLMVSAHCAIEIQCIQFSGLESAIRGLSNRGARITGFVP